MKSGATDLTVGNELKVIVKFALPVYASNFLLQCYNLTDVAIIGNYLGDHALTSMGAVSTIYGLFIALIFGMSSGFAVITSKHYGSGDREKLHRGLFNTMILALIWVVLISSIGMISLKPLMRLLGTPEGSFEEGYGYASIMIGFVFFTFCYNVFSAQLRAIGNSLAPLIFLAVSVTSNIGLDLLFVVHLGFGLKGAACATIIAQTLSASVCLLYILKFVPELRFSRKDMKIDRAMLMDIFTAGISFAMMFSVVNLGTMILQRAINGLGDTIIAAHVSARKISELCMMTLSTLASSMATFAGQNHGAKKHDRVKRGLKKTILLGFGIATFLNLLIYTAGPFMVKLISGSSNQELISNAVFYLKFDLPFYYVLAIILITRSTLQGLGSKIAPLVASLMELILKILTAGVLVKYLGYTGIAMCEPIIWTVCAVYILIVFANNKNINPSRKTSLS